MTHRTFVLRLTLIVAATIAAILALAATADAASDAPQRTTACWSQGPGAWAVQHGY